MRAVIGQHSRYDTVVYKGKSAEGMIKPEKMIARIDDGLNKVLGRQARLDYIHATGIGSY